MHWNAEYVARNDVESSVPFITVPVDIRVKRKMEAGAIAGLTLTTECSVAYSHASNLRGLFMAQ